jgi:hypothetical protein
MAASGFCKGIATVPGQCRQAAASSKLQAVAFFNRWRLALSPSQAKRLNKCFPASVSNQRQARAEVGTSRPCCDNAGVD